MPSAGMASKAAPATIAAARATIRQREGGRWELRPCPGAVGARRPIGDDRRDGEEPARTIRNVQLNVCHGLASWYERRSARASWRAWPRCSDSTSSATAIEW